jgi:twitching motility protein PilI
VLPVPEQVTRVPGAKPWLRGIANLRGQLLTVVDLKAFLGGGSAGAERQARILIVASREVPTGLIVDEVVGFRRFGSTDFRDETPAAVIRCEHYLEGCYRRGSEVWPRFSFLKLLADQQFLTAGETAKA